VNAGILNHYAGGVQLGDKESAETHLDRCVD